MSNCSRLGPEGTGRAGIVLFPQAAAAELLVQEVQLALEHLIFVQQRLLLLRIGRGRQPLLDVLVPVVEELLDAGQVALPGVQQCPRTLVDGHRGGHLAHGQLLLGRQPIGIEVVFDLLGALHRRLVQRVVQDGQGEFCQFVLPFGRDPYVDPAILAVAFARAVFVPAFFATDVEPTAVRLEAFGGDDAVGPLTDVAVRIARVEHFEAGLAVGAISRHRAASAVLDGQLVRAAHQFELARIVDRRDGVRFLLRPL